MYWVHAMCISLLLPQPSSPVIIQSLEAGLQVEFVPSWLALSTQYT